AWGGLLMPVVWTGVSYVALSIASPALPGRGSWPWFIVSQFVFGITMPAVVLGAQRLPGFRRRVGGGLVGGAGMGVPGFLVAAGGQGIWYRVSVVAGMVLPGPGSVDVAELGGFRLDWFVTAAVLHAVLSVSFGVLFVLVSRVLPRMPGPVAWGGLVLPLVWTGVSYRLLGVVTSVLMVVVIPVLQVCVGWPWFVVSQFVFGVTAAVVVLRSEMIHVAPAGLERQGDRETGRQGEGP